VTLLGVLGSVFAVGASASFSLLGYLLLFLAVLSYAFHCVFVEKSSQISGIEITFLMAGMGFLVFAFLALLQGLFEGNLSQSAGPSFSECQFSLGYPLSGSWLLGSGLFPVQQCHKENRSHPNILLYRHFNPGFHLLGYSLSRETFSPFQALAAILIILGVYLSNRG